jgi:hypothetical protein
MSSDDDRIIRNGSLKEWAEYALLNYFITFGGNRVRAVYVFAVALAVAGLVGGLV